MASSQLFEHAERAKSRTLAELLAQNLESPWEATGTRRVTGVARGVGFTAGFPEQDRRPCACQSGPIQRRESTSSRQGLQVAERATLRLVGSEASSAPRGTPVTADDIGATLPSHTSLVEFYFARETIFRLLRHEWWL